MVMRFINKFKYKTIAWTHISWTRKDPYTDEQQPVSRICVEFLINGFGKTKVVTEQVMGNPRDTDDIRMHSYYDQVIRPFLKRGRWARWLSDEELIATVEKICEDTSEYVPPVVKVRKKPSGQSSDNKVITVDFKNHKD